MPLRNSFPTVHVYTDGGCDPNPGPGGWGAVLVWGKRTKEINGGEPATTNNRMELTAAIAALRLLKRPCHVLLHTDSQYLHLGITEWLSSWMARGWRRADGRPVENQDLWQELVQLASQHDIEWIWLRGHSGDPLNERADQLARLARRQVVHHDHDAVPQDQDALPKPQEPTGDSIEEVGIYARGCALGVPGPAGYGAVVVYTAERQEEISGSWPLATSNVMELWAVIAGLRSLSKRSRVHIYTTSKYVLDGATRWLGQWERHNWRTRQGSPVKHREIWQELSHLMGDHEIIWHHMADKEVAASQHAALLARREAQAVRDGGA